MTKIIFLDIDGVVFPHRNNDSYNYDLHALPKLLADKFNDASYLTIDNYLLGFVYYDWQPQAIKYLKRLIKKTDAKIVLTSSWRSFGFELMQKLFKIQGLDSYLIDMTTKCEDINGAKIDDNNYFCSERKIEINDYLDNHDIDSYVIIDDLDLRKYFPGNCVYTYVENKNYYFNFRNYFKAKRILKNSLHF